MTSIRTYKYPRIKTVQDLRKELSRWKAIQIMKINNASILHSIRHRFDVWKYTYRKLNRNNHHAMLHLKVRTSLAADVARKKVQSAITTLKSKAETIISGSEVGIKEVEQKLHHTIDPVIEFGDYVKDNWESVWRFLGILTIRNSIRDTYNYQTNLAIRLDNVNIGYVGELILSLHEAGEPFRLLNIGEQSDTGVADHIRWFLSETAGQKDTVSKERPRATMDYGTWQKWYLDMAEQVAKKYTRWLPVLVINQTSISQLPKDFTKRVFGKGKLILLIHRLLTYQSTEEALTRLTLNGSQFQTLEKTVLPSRIDVGKEMVRIESQPENGTNQVAWYSIMKIDSLPSQQYDGDLKLRDLLLPLVSANRNIIITTDWYPIPRQSRSGFLKIVKKRIRRYEYGTKNRDSSIASTKNIDYLKTICRNIIQTDAHTFGRHTVLILKADTEESLERLRNNLTEVLRQAEIHSMSVKGQYELKDAFRHILPIGPDPLDMDEVIPESETGLGFSLLQSRIPVPIKGVLTGMYKRNATPLILGGLIKMILVSGGLGSGKSTVIKNVVWNFQYIQPSKRTIVIDNSGYSSTNGHKEYRSGRAAGLRGWFDICRLFGGKTVFAEDAKNPDDLDQILRELKDTRFILYYPDPKRPDKDLCFLKWVSQELKRNANPKATEEDVQQMLVLDDILGWLSVTNDDRSRYLFLHVIPIIKSTGTLTMMAMQTSGALREADKPAFEMLKGVMEMSISFPTTAHADVADNLGIRSSTLTPEGNILSQSVAEEMRLMTMNSLFQGDISREANIVIGNLISEQAIISIHPEILKIISRMELSPDGQN